MNTDPPSESPRCCLLPVYSKPGLYCEARRRPEAPPGVSHDCPVSLPGSNDRFCLYNLAHKDMSKYRTFRFFGWFCPAFRCWKQDSGG